MSFHEIRRNDIQGLRTLPFTDTRSRSQMTPSLYQLRDPLEINICSFHPNREEHCYQSTVVSPTTQLSFTQTREMIMPHLKTAKHHHDYYELLFVLEGEVYQLIENEGHLYPEGSCCILNKKVQHTERYSTDFTVLFLHLSDKLLREIQRNLSLQLFGKDSERKQTNLEKFLEINLADDSTKEKNYVDFMPLRNDSWNGERLLQALEAVWNELIEPGRNSSTLILGELTRIFCFLNNPLFFQTTPFQFGTSAENRIFDQITEEMQHSYGRTSRRELEKKLNYSGVYLNNITKKFTGLSLFDYGMTFCMRKTAELLLDSTMTISEISAEMGFTNRTHFYKLFEENYHMSPSAYRKTHVNLHKGKPGIENSAL